MNKIRIIVIGRIKNLNLLTEINNLKKRVKRLEILELKEIKGKNIEEIKKREEFEILKAIDEKYNTYLLCEDGREFNTMEFSKLILSSTNHIQFIISGPQGPSLNLRRKIKNHLSLSKMTFTHEQALYLLIEQIYRVSCVEKNINYTK